MIGQIFDDMDTMVTLAAQMGVQVGGIRDSLQKVRETYAQFEHIDFNSPDFMIQVQDMAEKQANKMLDKLMDKYDLDDDERQLITECSDKIIAYAKTGEIPEGEIDELKELITTVIGKEHVEAVMA